MITSVTAIAQDESLQNREEALGEVQVITMPACNDTGFKSKILEAAEKYFNDQPIYSIISKRKKFLKLKYVY